MRSCSSFGRSLGRRVRARGGNVKWRNPGAAQSTKPGCRALHCACPCCAGRIHRGNRDRGDRISMVWGARWRMVGVDNRSDFPGRGVGSWRPDALSGTLRVGLGRPSWGCIFGNPDPCGRGRDGLDRLDAQGSSDRLSVVPIAVGKCLRRSCDRVSVNLMLTTQRLRVEQTGSELRPTGLWL